MSPRGLDAQASEVVPGWVVLGRVWLGGLLWGLIGGIVVAFLVVPYPWVAFALGAAVGLVVGTLPVVVVAVVLVADRRDRDVSPSLAAFVTLCIFFGLMSLPAGLLDPVHGTGLIGLVLLCAFAACPMHLTLRRALRPVGESA